jgi:hypothetical protein
MASLYIIFQVEITNARVGSFWDAFVFSFQTSSTLGFGYFLSKSDLGHIVVMLETFSGIFFVAIVTGKIHLMFSRKTVSTKTVDLFNASFLKLKKSGVLDKIKNKYLQQKLK